jgi:hypothetical protein
MWSCLLIAHPANQSVGEISCSHGGEYEDAFNKLPLILFRDFLFTSLFLQALARTFELRFWVVAPCSLIELYRRFRGPDDGGSKDLWNVGKLLPDYRALQPRRQPSSYSPPWEPQILLIVMLLFWVLVSCRLIGRYQRFGETYYLHFQGWSGEAGKWRDLYRVIGRKGWRSGPIREKE